MGLTARDKGGGEDFKPIQEGLVQGICIGIWDLGTQYVEKYNSKVHKCVIMWELPAERIEINGKDLPRGISRTYRVSLHKKADLKRDLEHWRGKAFTDKEKEGFDISKLLGVNCTLQILHNTVGDKIYANIDGIIPLMPHMKKSEPENPIRYFSFEDGGNIPENTPDWIVDIIKRAEEWRKDKPDQDEYPGDEIPPIEDDIPF